MRNMYTGNSNVQLLRWLLYWGVLLLLVFLLVVPPLITLVLLDKVAPVHWVSIVFPSMGVAWVFTFGLLWIGSRRLGKPPSPSPTTKQLIVIVSIVALIVLAILLSLRFNKSAQDHALLNGAQQHFSVIGHGNISPQQVDSELIKLEGEYQKLREPYEVPVFSAIVEVNLYPNVREFELATKQTEALGSTNCTENVPIIYLPVENIDSVSSEQYFSSTPEHEMVHAVICNLVGRQQQANTIPLWFHEGLAEYESLKGTSNIFERLGYRWYLWRHKSETMPVDEFQSATYPSSAEERTMFYSSSFEFMRYITSKFGEQTPWNVLKEVAQGVTFDTAFKHVTNSDSTHEYEKWLLDY